MICAVCVILLSWYAAPHVENMTPQVPVAADSPQDWESLIARLREVEGIEASLVGFVDTPSEQYALYEAAIAQGRPTKFLALAQDEHPVVRCVGLLALARTEGQEAVPTLRAHLCDRDIVRYQVLDIHSAMTVGQFALDLLHDPNCLVCDRRPIRSPLLPETELPGLYLSILAGDATVSVHDDAARNLNRLLGQRKVALDLPMLQQMAPSLTDWQIIKAIGRMKLSDTSRTFLIACVEMDELSAEARLAAASALTRHTDVECARALRVGREALNQIDGTPWGDFFVETLNARRTHEENMALIRKARSWREQESMKDHIIRTFTCDHPLATDDLLSVPAPVVVRKYADVREALVNSLVAISANLDRFSQSWSTYADTAFKLDQFLGCQRMWEREDARARAAGSKTSNDALLTEEQCAQIERNINKRIGPTTP